MSPAAPLPCVVTEIFAPSLMARDGAVTPIRPAFPLLLVVLKTPLAAPAMDTDSPALIVTFPPAPPRARGEFIALLWIWPPFVTLNVLSSVTMMSPALPESTVLVFTSPLSIVRAGAVIFSRPTSARFAWLAMLPPAEMTTGSRAVTDTLPPWKEVDEPLWIVALSVTVRLPTSSEMSPTTAEPAAVLLIMPLGAAAPRGPCPDRRTASAVTVTFGAAAVLLAEPVRVARPVIVSGPFGAPVMSPAIPPPAGPGAPERDRMLPPSPIVKEEPEMVTGPRFSPISVKLVRLLETPEMVSGPVALIVTPPVVPVLEL